MQTGNQTDAEDRDDAGSATWHEGVVQRRKEIKAPCLVDGLLAAQHQVVLVSKTVCESSSVCFPWVLSAFC